MHTSEELSGAAGTHEIRVAVIRFREFAEGSQPNQDHCERVESFRLMHGRMADGVVIGAIHDLQERLQIVITQCRYSR